MKLLGKNILRYLLKNKFITGSLITFMLLVTGVFSTFQGISTSMSDSYNSLVANYNLHDLVIYPNFNDVNADTLISPKQLEFNEALDKLGLYYRLHESVNVLSSTDNTTTKVIKYENTYQVDQLDIYDQYGLIQNSTNGHFELPNSYDYREIIKKSQANLTDAANQHSVFARQQILYFAANANWDKDTYQKEMLSVLDYIQTKDPTIDPLNPSDQLLQSLPNAALKNTFNNVKKYMAVLCDPSNSNYSPPIIRGSRISFSLTALNNGLPVYGFFEDPSSFVGVVSPNWLKANKKEIFPFEEFAKAMGYSNGNDFIQNPKSITDLPKAPPSSLADFVSKVDDKYKININSLEFLILGSGITPDMMFPIISAGSLVPNPINEAIVYANSNGYEKVSYSFASSEHEKYIAAKSKGLFSKNQILDKVKQYVQKYMSWPSNINVVFWYDDQANQMSPATLRVTFITQLLSVIQAVTYGIILFIAIVLIIVLCLFARMFIQNNKTTIAILISNGLNKFQILFSLSLIGLFISILAIPIGYFIGTALQPIAYSIFSEYWMIPVSFHIFNPTVFFVILVIIPIFFMLVTFLYGLWMLRKNVNYLLKEDQNISMSKPTLWMRNVLKPTPIMFKFRGSLAFNSILKIIFLTMATLTLSAAFSFLFSSNGAIKNAYELESKNNTSSFALNLVTPTIQGGQYYAIDERHLGRNIVNSKGEVVFEKNLSKGFYASAYKNSPLFKEFSISHWASASDSQAYVSNLVYLKNVLEIYNIINISFGLGDLSSNPVDVLKSLAPDNQINGLYTSWLNVSSRIMQDMRPYNQAYTFKFNKNGLTKGSEYITPDAKNSFQFPSTFYIANIQNYDPSTWELNFEKSADIGLLSAPEINGIKNKSAQEIVEIPFDQLEKIINDAYLTYTPSTDINNIPSSNEGLWETKYYQDLLPTGSIANVSLVSRENAPSLIKIDLNPDMVKDKFYLTNRSLFTLFFSKPQTINDTNQIEIATANLLPDPFNPFVGYKIQTSKILSSIPTNINTKYINFSLKNYIDPVMVPLIYRIEYNQFLFNSNHDEPYAYIEGNLKRDVSDPINIKGIVDNSRFIHLKNKSGDDLNKLLYESTIENPLVVNEYSARKYNLQTGSKLSLTVSNSVNRFNIDNVSELLTYNSNNTSNGLLNGEIKPSANSQNEITFNVVGISNTGNGNQMYTKLDVAQNAIGLATAEDYINGLKLSNIPTEAQVNKDPTLNITQGMNNNFNTFGGFNGIFTNSEKPISLTQNLSLYSLNGMYPATDAWESNSLMDTLLKNTLTLGKNKIDIRYLANAFNLPVSELIAIKDKYLADFKADPNAPANTDAISIFAEKVRILVNSIYGKLTLATGLETVESVSLSKLMFDKMSLLYDDVTLVVVILIVLLSLLIVILVSIMIVNDMVKLIGIMKTLGYSNNANGLSFIVGFIPSWVLTVLISVPLVIGLVSLFDQFIFTNIGLVLGLSVNWLAFSLIQIGILGIIGIIYLFAVRHFKKKNLLELLKW